MHNALWRVATSNGENFYEGKGKFIEVDGEQSPWNKLLSYLEETEQTITSLGLYTDDGRTFNLPSLGKNPKFSVFSEAQKPLKYNFFRALSQDIQTDDKELFTVIEAVYEGYSLQLWVDENNTQNSWVLVR